MQQIAAPPIQDSVVNPPERNDPTGIWAMGQSWVNWIIRSLMKRVSMTAVVLKVAEVSANAAIATTPLELPLIADGEYRLSWYLEITTAAATSSSVTVTLSWTHNAKSLSLSGAAVTSNTTTSVQSGSIVIQADANSALNYATAYASNAASQMVYTLVVVAEQLN